MRERMNGVMRVVIIISRILFHHRYDHMDSYTHIPVTYISARAVVKSRFFLSPSFSCQAPSASIPGTKHVKCCIFFTNRAPRFSPTNQNPSFLLFPSSSWCIPSIARLYISLRRGSRLPPWSHVLRRYS